VASGIAVSVTGQPWLTFSATDGSFKLLAPAGNGAVTLRDLTTGDTGSQVITMPPTLAGVDISISSLLSGLRISSVTPADEAQAVPQVVSITVNFNRPINPVALVSGALQLRGTNGSAIDAAVSLNLANNAATLLPNVPLDASTQYKIVLSTNIADSAGHQLEGKTEFTFTTIALSTRNPAAQLIIYEPGATNLTADVTGQLPGYQAGTNKSLVVVQGTAGSADPGVPVIIANEGSGETTTVLSKTDGSFTTFVSGLEQDYISATFVNLNGTRVYIPVNRQLFDDGSIGLFPQGGVLQVNGENGPVSVTVPPNAIGTRAKFKLESVNTAKLTAQLGGVTPSIGAVAGGALNLRIEGQAPTLPLHVRFPVDLSTLGYPTNEAPTNVAAVLVVARTNSEITGFEVKDQLLFTPQSSSQRTKARRLSSGVRDQITAGFLDSGVGFLAILPGGQVAQNVFYQVIMPIVLGPRPVVVKGKVSSIPLEIAIGLQEAGALSAAVNLQTGQQSVDIPFQLAQQMNLVKGALGNAVNKIQGLGQLLQIGVQALQLWVVANAEPLSGAFVNLTLSGGPLNHNPGRLFPGMVYCTSGSDGLFLMVAPAVGAQYLVTATHPLFDETQVEPVNPISLNPLSPQGDLSLGGAVFKNFFFSKPLISQTPPSVSVAFEPLQPAAGQPCHVQITATQPLSPPILHISLVSVGTTNLLTGLIETNAIGVLTNEVRTTPTKNTLQYNATLLVNKPVTARLKLFVQGANLSASYGPQFLDVQFTGPKAPAPTDLPAPDTNDVHGPLVVQTDPPEGGFIGENSEITIDFNKPIDAFVTNTLNGITLSGPGTPLTPIVRLNPGQRTMVVQFPGLVPAQPYTLTLSGQSIRDLATPPQPLDQHPSTAAADSFTLNFRTTPVASAPVQGLSNGRGSVISGNRLYVLDQTPQDNLLKIYDVTIPLQPRFLGQKHLFGQPRDLVVIPQYGYVRNVHAAAETNDLVVVVGGDLDAQINQVQGTTVSVRGQYLWVLNVSNPSSPEILASPIVSYRVSSVVPKVKWAPPFLVYQEFGADIQLLTLVNLQELIIGYNSTPAERAAFPPPERRNQINSGVDTNFDGDYVDPGESPPIPDLAPAEFYGKHQSYVLQRTTQKILDFSATRGGGIVGVTLSRGVFVGPNNPANVIPLQPSYRTLAFDGRPLNLSDPTDALHPLGSDAYPRWVSILPGATIKLGGVPTVLTLALVSLQQPETNGVQQLAVIDISLPESPRLLNKIPVPVSLLGGSLESVTVNSDGTADVSGGQNRLVLDIASLGITNVIAGQLHPAILSFIPNAGALSRSVGTTDFGVRSVAEGGRAVVVQSPPKLLFVSFPKSPAVVNPTLLASQSQSNVNQIMSGMRPTGALAPARAQAEPSLFLNSDLEPAANPALHFHVLVFAPGGAGPKMELGLESLNPVGRPLSNPGQGFAPVRAISPSAQVAIDQMPRPNCGATIRSLPAYRVSKDPHSEFYNWYLSRPFALVTETVSSSDLVHFQNTVGSDPGDREILFSGAQLRAFIDPEQVNDPDTGPVVGLFAAQIDQRKKRIYPVSTVTALTINRDYIAGDNPPPSGGSSPFEDTYGTIQAHSGELRTTDVDLSVPSPRMPIGIFRTIGNQDTYEGPFGVGWDFNYNQRLTILDPLTFPEGLQIPLVVRDTKEDSDIAGSQDVLFNDGEGRVIHFRWTSTNLPPEYAQDPLVKEFDYQNLVSDYYLPQRGVFNLLVKFKDGRFERLAPSGMRYRYAAAGRLESILDSYPQNRHDLEYDRNGWLVRIDDRSVSAPRYVQVGHLRRLNSDPDFVAGLDEDTSNSYLEGVICRLRDHTGRDVLFQYDSQGFLTNRLDVEVHGENGGFAGRSQTFYSYVDCRLATISATASGVPLVSAVNATSSSGKHVAQSTSGSYGNTQLTIPINNSAKTVGTQTAGVQVGDGSSVQRRFDNRGNLTSTTVSGLGDPPVTETRSNTVDGLVAFIRHPEGNTETMTYDSQNNIFRSRGNLLNVTVDPGPRGGPGSAQAFLYDPRYNQQSGVQLDANNFRTTYTLTSDGRSVATIDYGGGASRTASYNSLGQVTHTVDENGVEHTTVYDGTTGFVRTESSGSITYTYGYDSSTASQLGRPASIAPPLGAPTTFVYNQRMQPVQIARGALVTKTAYDEIGRAIFHQEDLGDQRQLITRRAFNEKDFLTNTVISGVEVNGVVSSLSTTFVPDKRSRTGTVIHPNGTSQKFEYDSRGNTTKVTFGDYSEEFTYDLNNNLTSVKQGGDLVRTYAYDGMNRSTNVVRMTGTQNYVQSSAFYAGGELQSQALSDPVFGTVQQLDYGSIDALGRHLTVAVKGNVIAPQYTYAYHALASEITGPRMVSSTTWDTAGNSISYTDPTLQTVIHHDANGRVFQTDSQEEGATYTQMFTFDDLDNRKSLSDLLGTRFVYEPRADGNYTKITNLRGNSVTLEHTALGELQRKKRADGMEVQYRHDAERQTVYQGDPGAGFNYGYDDSLRLTNRTLRSGVAMGFSGFDPRSMPTAITLPGGSETRQYDLQRRLLHRKLSYQSTSVEEAYTYDALDRVRVQTYVQNAGNNNSASFDYDPAGPMLAAHFHEDARDFNVTYGYYPDGLPRSVTYPSGITVTETRDGTGRLTGVSDNNGNIISATSWQGNSEPRVLQLGATMQIVHQYDARGRVTGSRMTRNSDGAILVHLRYQYDAANNIQIRQYLHRGGKSDVFGFDAGERVSQAQIGVLVTNAAGLGPSLYRRDYNYNAAGLDYLTTAVLSGTAPQAPPFATNWTSHDAFLLPAFIDSFPRRLSDPKGNVASADLWVRPAGASAAHPVSATLQHDGLGRLTQVTRSDGITIDHQYQPGGLRFSTKVTQGGSVVRNSAYIYDSSGRLIEEYDRSVTPPSLIARYYYASGDAPVAADLNDPGSGLLKRYYYLTDASLSVVALADASGNVVERVWYDTFGQPSIEQRDSAAPTVTSVQAGSGGSLLVTLSEPVQPPWTDPGPGGGIVVLSNAIPGSVTAIDTGSGKAIAGTATLEAAMPGFRPFSVVRFTPSQPAAGALSLTLVGGSLSDEWGNTNLTSTYPLTNSQPAGAVYFQAQPQTDTAPVSLARSDLNSPFLFHGQYFDYDSGLIYLRARFYDAFSGMFFEPDPLGYEASVNHYAGLANNPVSFRDPSGLRPKGITDAAYHSFLHSSGYSSAELHLLSAVHPTLTRLGMGDLEIAAHVRVMYQEHQQNRTWEIGIRSFDDKAATRLARIDEFHQTKEEKVFAKTREDGLARHEEEGKETGEVFAGDLDGLYAKLNGQIATIDHLANFQSSVNKEVERLSADWKAMANEGGQTIHGTEVQKAYQHGFSLNIPQEYGTKHALSDGGRFGFQAIENINTKMKKGIGGAFSFKFDPNESRFRESINEHVNVDAAVQEHEAFYTDHLFNPASESFNRRLNDQRVKQSWRDQGEVHEKLFPKPFYYKNN
jgi:RHS repeat-associated protein